MDVIAQAASHIIQEQKFIIGPLSVDQAKKVAGLQINGPDDVVISGDAREVLSNLVNQYAKLFGPASVEVCKQAFKPYADKVQPEMVPDVLR